MGRLVASQETPANEQMLAPLAIAGMKPVGQYAYSIEFSDGHSSGIYTLEYLRELGGPAAGSALPVP